MQIGRNSSSVLFAGLITACVAFDLFTRLHVFPLVIFLAATAAIHEATRMAHRTGARPWRLGAWALVMFFVLDGWHAALTHADIILMVGLIGLFVHAVTHSVRSAFASVGSALLCALWVGAGFGSLLALWSWNGVDGASREGRYLIVFLLPTAMAQDVFAMWAGSALGRRRITPYISPNKSLEGSIGGVAGSLLMGLLIWGIFERFEHSVQGLPLSGFMAWHDAVALSLLFGTVGQLGDLAESLLKREAGVKDSGTTYTGHGGVLDLFDSVLFCAPVMYLWAFARGLWMFGP